jgi:hypothetical protein
MIRIYTDKSLCPNMLITLNDKHFNTNVSKEYLDEKCRALMKNVDGAVILDETQWTVKTRFGTGDIRNLSTGVKTLINIYNLIKQKQSGTVDVREVGENLVPMLFNLARNSEISLFTGKCNIVGLVDESGDFLVDNTHMVSGTVNLSLKLEELKRRSRA